MTDMNPVPATDGPDEGSGSGVNRRTAGLVAVGLVVVLALAAYLVLGGGGGSTDDASGVVPKGKPTASAAPSSSAPAATPKPTVEPADNEDVEGRDPFAALLVEPPEETKAPAATPQPTPPAPSPDPVPTVAPTPDPVVIARLTMTSANDEKNTASFKVDSTVYKNVHVGDTFGTYFQLYMVDGECGGVVYGDSSIPLCVGTTVPVYA